MWPTWSDVLQLAILSTILCRTIAQAGKNGNIFVHDHRAKPPKRYGKFVGPSFPPNVQLMGYPDRQYETNNDYYDSLEQPPMSYRREDAEKPKEDSKEASKDDKSSEKSRYPRPNYSHFGPFFHDMKKNEPDFHRELWFKMNKLKRKKGTEHRIKFARALEGYTRWISKDFPHRGWLDYTYVPFVPKKMVEFQRKRPGKLRGETLVIG